MKVHEKDVSRRHFMKTAGAAGVGALMGTAVKTDPAKADSAPSMLQADTVQKRVFGKSGIFVSALSLGGMFDIPNSQLLLKQALKWGVSYWDTAHIYGSGRSEKGIGKFFKKYPEQRKQIFLVTKSTARSPRGLSRDLENSLDRMNTDHVDLFFVHAINRINTMTQKIRQWGQEQKSRGRIKLIGFSTHSNMASCLLGASKLGWIDGIMMTYNFRLMHQTEMKKAVRACTDAGIGLTAMKTQGGAAVRTDTEKDLALGGHFVKKGFTPYQAKLKAVWEDPNIASICSQMPTLSILMSNIAAAVDRTTLTRTDRKHLDQYAADTYSHYCAGCTHLCQSALPGDIPVGDVMRYLMYARDYGDRHHAADLFGNIPGHIRKQMKTADYVNAEKSCPRSLNIGQMMKEACKELA